MRRTFLITIISLTAAAALPAQEPVAVGRGSYAAYPPTYKSRTDAHDGSWATMLETSRLYLDEKPSTPIPTNDWWTDLLHSRYANALWSLPTLVKPSAEGVAVHYPTYWIENGTEVKSRTSLTVGAESFTATEAIAADWHDWDVVMRLPGRRGGEMRVTLAHGMPFTWFEFTGLNPAVKFSATPVFYNAYGEEISAADLALRHDTALGVVLGDDAYGLYLPEGARLSYVDGTLRIEQAAWLSVGLLPSAAETGAFAEWACSVPRSTEVSWSYDEARALLSTVWTVEAENLARPGAPAPVLQGFLPHAYKHAADTDIQYIGYDYLSPRGRLRMAVSDGNTFSYSMRFPGIMPQYAAPTAGTGEHAFDPARLRELTQRYAAEGDFGADTYWGGKGLIQMAMNMTFALETGDTETYETSRRRLRSVMENWLTYTPGEDRYFFAYYPRWGSLVGYEYSYDSDRFNDHHFHYGYMLYAGALLCLNDPDFRAGYGEMLKLVAKDFANWDRTDTRFPMFRTLDPWVGHSYAGGLGDGANDNGNGQESSSEAMQGWGGVYLLGVALGDDAMRDAGIYGWLTESNGVAEYWFDRDHIYPGCEHNYDYTLYEHPYNTNITSKGIGWWTWFSGDPLWMHSIQWMPVSPCLNYLSADLDFVKWDYETMEKGTAYDWFETRQRGEETLEPLARQSVGNVVLSYLERYDPQRAAAIFDQAWDTDMPLARSIDTGHISYYVIHSHLTHGDPDYTVYASIPTANAYRRADGTMTYMAYNPGSAERTVSFYRDGELLRTVRVPAGRRVVCFTDEARPASVELACSAGRYVAAGASADITARVLDTYGATWTGNLRPVLSVAPGAPAAIDASGRLTVAATAATGTEIKVTATADGLAAADLTLTVGEQPRAERAAITPAVEYAEVGVSLAFEAAITAADGSVFEAEAWSVTDASGAEVADGPAFTPSRPGKYTVSVTADGRTFSHTFMVTPPLPDLAAGRPAVSSGEENAGCLTSNATDGDHSNRWGSQHTDDQWIYVDLGAECLITRTVIDWEAAYAASYAIEVAPDGAPTAPFTGTYADGQRTIQAVTGWTEVKTVAGISQSGTDEQTLSATGRYLRIRGIRRGTAYGYSLHELEVHGIPAGATAADVIGIDIDVPALVDEGRPYTFNAVAWTLGGESTPADAAWTSSMEGAFDGNVFTAPTYGQATITATTPEGYTATARTMVCESVKMSGVTVEPAYTQIILGQTASLEVTANNQFGGMWQGEFADPEIYEISDPQQPVRATGVGYAGGVFSAEAPGCYRLDFPGGAQATVDVVALEKANLALGKSATATSVRDGNHASLATDGNSQTRWESEWSDGHSITVDLEEAFVINRAVIDWEGAYATVYSLHASLDGEGWTELWNTADGRGGIVEASFEPTPARYVKLQCDKRGTGYGNSIHELEVYGLSRYGSSAESNLTDGDDTPVDVYTLQGFPLRRGVSRATALDGLPAGLYIVGDRKIAKSN